MKPSVRRWHCLLKAQFLTVLKQLETWELYFETWWTFKLPAEGVLAFLCCISLNSSVCIWSKEFRPFSGAAHITCHSHLQKWLRTIPSKYCHLQLNRGLSVNPRTMGRKSFKISWWKSHMILSSLPYNRLNHTATFPWVPPLTARTFLQSTPHSWCLFLAQTTQDVYIIDLLYHRPRPLALFNRGVLKLNNRKRFSH